MVLNTLTVGAAVTPTVIKTSINHYFDRKKLHLKPTAHISYHEGISLIRQFLLYASHHTVEEVQTFTAQWVPAPTWVRTENILIAEEFITAAAEALIENLGHKGIDRIGGKKWWQWRPHGLALRAEWIDMKHDYNERKKNKEPCKRVMLYVHGGAYFFGSVDEHRYQLQRHARKLKARVLAPRYRLAPQFPFPCGLLDCLAVYLYLLTVQDPSTIILAGDSAGGGMVLSMLVLMRDQRIPLPAGAVLISPWVDLTHSFPSVAGDNPMDYIPPYGFMQRPSIAWPPPNSDDMAAIAKGAVEKVVAEKAPHNRKEHDVAVQGFETLHASEAENAVTNPNNPAKAKDEENTAGNTIPGPGHDISIEIDGKLVVVKDQIQMYASNQLINHPLVSPVLQPSLGGLPPLLFLVGGGEMLRDEQIYTAHKAAHPSKFPPSDAYLEQHPEVKDDIKKYKPTLVQLQVWEDLCHVAPTLSFTRPAKYMYRSVAQFSAWALARAQKIEIEIVDDDNISIISKDESDDETKRNAGGPISARDRVDTGEIHVSGQIGQAGDALPAFKNHMIRQRVDRHGKIFELEPENELPAMLMSPNDVGVVKPGPVRKWMEAKKKWDTRYASQKRAVQKRRMKEMAKGYADFGEDDVPPPSALAGRRGLETERKLSAKMAKPKMSWGLRMWSMFGSNHDKDAIVREQAADAVPEVDAVAPTDPQTQTRPSAPRSRSRRRQVSDVGQGDDQTDREDVPAMPVSNPNLLSPVISPVPTRPAASAAIIPAELDSAPYTKDVPSEETKSPEPIPIPGTNATLDNEHSKRPKANGVAFPFKLNSSLAPSKDVDNASMMTLTSFDQRTNNVTPLGHEGEEKQLGAVAGTAVGSGSATAAVASAEPHAETQAEKATERTVQDYDEGETPKATARTATPGFELDRPAFERFDTAQTQL